jgi:hypothetical protein
MTLRTALMGIALVAGLLAGCSAPDTPAVIETKSDGQLHTDKKPVTDEFPRIAGVDHVYWLENVDVIGGDPRVPGPSIFRFEAVIYLDAAGTKILKDGGHQWEPATPGWADHIDPRLSDRAADPAGWVHSPSYDHDYGSKNEHYHGAFQVDLEKGILYFAGATT